ncbi:hypothetical protein EWI07_02210 [Sporolactobacillus sp. THM7-4]|nr:hypothetical protein EWI07_02210 [Sporolactobacillus sp. THM7-4]
MEEKKESGFGFKLFKFLLAVLVPILFLLLLTLLFLKLAGLDPIEEAKRLVFGQGSPATMQTGNGTSGSGSQIAALKQKIAVQNSTIKRLQSDSSKKSDQISQLNSDLKQAQAAAKQQTNASKNQASAGRQAVYAQTYKNMDPEKAAAIFEKLPTRKAAMYINMMDNKTKAQILENMTAGKAAALTPLLQASQKNSTSSQNNPSLAGTVTTTGNQ